MKVGAFQEVISEGGRTFLLPVVDRIRHIVYWKCWKCLCSETKNFKDVNFVFREEVKYCIERLEEQPLIQLPPGASAGGSAMQCQRDPLFQGLDPGRCFHVNLQLKFKMRVPTDLRLSSASTSIQSPVCTHPIGNNPIPRLSLSQCSHAL